MSFDKVLDHPNVNMIVKMLSEGKGIRKVEKTLKEMYPEDKKKHLSTVTLQKFRKEHLKIEGDALDTIKQAVRAKKKVIMAKKEHTRVKKIPSYKEKIEEAVNLHIDIKQQLANMHILITARMENLFDKLASGESVITDEMNLQKYFQTYITVLERWAKYIDKVADHTVETNVNITVIEDQMAVIREAIREILLEMNPLDAMKFMEKLDRKMKNLNYKHDRPQSLNSMHSEVKTLSATVEDVDNVS